QHQGRGLSFELGGKRTSLLAHQTPLSRRGFSPKSVSGISRPLQLGSVRNIGWLGRGQQYSRGRVSSGLLDKLKLIIMSEGAVDFHVNRVMSAHECVVAGCRDLFVGDVGLGFSEIWIPGVEKGAYFASPSLILHYIEEHDYCPPQMYSEAVMAVDLEVGYKAQEVYVGLVAGHF
ncbi:hypothetical protein KZ863_26470, partial [Pseudomonas aeruginosa]